MNYREIKRELKRIKNSPKNWEIVEGDEDNYNSNYLGSYMSLDPCGKYHHFLSPNGVTAKCNRFWENLEKAANDLNMWTESGEGDPTDVYLCKSYLTN